MKNYSEFFRVATGEGEPFEYQIRLACGEPGQAARQSEWLSKGVQPKTMIIKVPTGLGKSAGVVLAYIWNRLLQAEGKSSGWQTRFVYCLPMRALVEQTVQNIERYLDNLFRDAKLLEITGKAYEELKWLKERAPIVLMGGAERSEAKQGWDIYPEKPHIIVGTQDMLLSRALNRGFGSSPYRWPMQFGLLNVDALWVFDETQLMGVSMETSAQLEAFRRIFNGGVNCVSWWMSATLNEGRLKTIDNIAIDNGPEKWRKIVLEEKDYGNRIVKARVEAKKPLQKAAIWLGSEDRKSFDKYIKELADFVYEKRARGGMTLVIVNRVARAQALYSALKKKIDNSTQISLIHSRFRPMDRKLNEEALKGKGERIIVATQAVEAGVDCSAKVLITEIAPWQSMVQRFGRCNRRGEYDKEVGIFWVDLGSDSCKEEIFLPYSKEEIETSRNILNRLNSASITELEKIVYSEPAIPQPIIRRKDIIELFDTTPDLSGLFIDVSRFIRDTKDNEVLVFWRENVAEIEKNRKPIEPLREELCRVAVGQFREFVKKASKKIPEFFVLRWDNLDEKWIRATSDKIYCGCVYLIDAGYGGYSEELGWTGNLAKGKDGYGEIKNLIRDSLTSESYGADNGSFQLGWVLLSDHLLDTRQMMDLIIGEIRKQTGDLLAQCEVDALLKAALWHDVGKAHPYFQGILKNGSHKPPDANGIYAKSMNSFARRGGERRYFRHELASALVWLLSVGGKKQEEKLGVDFENLVGYLIAAHHGKVRLSIRSLPDEKPEEKESQKEVRMARGIKDGDVLPSVRINGETAPQVTLRLDLMEIGDGNCGESWVERMLKLRDKIGVFKLAYLEALVRAADARASARYVNNGLADCGVQTGE
ncbi:MAG: type I-G CRISPR-associated helicase/endonuclease Cas3g [Verrucomicrobiia bacterium]